MPRCVVHAGPLKQASTCLRWLRVDPQASAQGGGGGTTWHMGLPGKDCRSSDPSGTTPGLIGIYGSPRQVVSGIGLDSTYPYQGPRCQGWGPWTSRKTSKEPNWTPPGPEAPGRVPSCAIRVREQGIWLDGKCAPGPTTTAPSKSSCAESSWQGWAISKNRNIQTGSGPSKEPLHLFLALFIHTPNRGSTCFSYIRRNCCWIRYITDSMTFLP